MEKAQLIRDERGTIILIVFLVLMVLGVIAGGLAILSVTNSTLAKNMSDHSKALQLADTGIARMKNEIYMNPFEVDTNNDGLLNEEDPPYDIGLVAVGKEKGSDINFTLFYLEDAHHPDTFESEDFDLWGYFRGRIKPLRYSIKLPQNFELAKVTAGGPDWEEFTLTYFSNHEPIAGMPVTALQSAFDRPIHQILFPVNLYLDFYSATFEVEMSAIWPSDVVWEVRFNTSDDLLDPPTTIGTDYEVICNITVYAGDTHGIAEDENMYTRLETPVRDWIGTHRPLGGFTGAYEKDIFEVTSMGMVGRTSRTIRSMLFVDSFLRYARFCKNNLRYRPNSEVFGMVYVDGDLNLTEANTFFRSVSVTGDIFNDEDSTFNGLKNTNAERLELPEERRMWIYKQLAQIDQGGGLMSDNPKGIFLKYDGTSPFNCDSGGGIRQLDLEADFDFSRWENERVMVFGAGISGGMGTPIKNFNGIVYIDKSFGDNNEFVNVKGHLHGKSITIFSDDDIWINGCITMGRTAFTDICSDPPCPVWELSFEGEENNPVNLGLVANRQIVIAPYATKILFIEAAMMSLHETNDPFDQLSWYSLTPYWPPQANPLQNVPQYYPELPFDNPEVLDHEKDLEAIINNYRYILFHKSLNFPEFPDALDPSGFPSFGQGNGNGRLDPYTYGSPIVDNYTGYIKSPIQQHSRLIPCSTPTAIPYTDCVDFNRYYFQVDLDNSGDVETDNRDGYDETKITTSFWFLRIKGPIITQYLGDVMAYGEVGEAIWRDLTPIPTPYNKLEEPKGDNWDVTVDDSNKDGFNDCEEFHPNYSKNTRRYIYDEDIVANPPPYFPVLLRRGDFISYREVEESKIRWVQGEY